MFDQRRTKVHTMDVAAIQMPCDSFSRDSNLSRAGDYLDYAARRGAELILLPELFSLGYSYEPRYTEFAEPRDGQTVQWLADQSRRLGCHIGATFVETAPGRIFNTFVLATPSGRPQFYRKQFLPLFEKLCFTAGRGDGIFETPLGRMGVFICWDITSQQLMRRYRGKIDFAVIVSAWPDMTTGNIPVLGAQGWTAGLALSAPQRISKTLDVPVLCCNMAGEFRTRVPWLGLNYRSLYVPSTCLLNPGSSDQRLCRKEGVLLGTIPRRSAAAANRSGAAELVS